MQKIETSDQFFSVKWDSREGGTKFKTLSEGGNLGLTVPRRRGGAKNFRLYFFNVPKNTIFHVLDTFHYSVNWGGGEELCFSF